MAKLIFGLTLAEAITQLDTESDELDPQNLFDMQPEDAFQIGFDTCLARLKAITGADPTERTLFELTPEVELSEDPTPGRFEPRWGEGL